MKKSTSILITLFVGGPVVLLIAFNAFFEKVPIDRVGVRVNQLSNTIDQDDHAPGYVFVAPFQHKLHLMDPTYQTLTLADHDAFTLRLRDGFQTTVDITLVYRLKPGLAHKAVERHGPGSRFKTTLKKIADKYIWQVMPELVTEDFYNTEKRFAKSVEAKNQMNEELEKEYLEVIDVLIRDIKYDPGFEERLRRKQKLDQEKLLLTSQRALADEQKETELIERETANMVIKINEERDKKIRELVADADASIASVKAKARREAETMIAQARSRSRQMVAQGELAKVEARAAGEKAINDAYRAPGGELYIARQIVQNVQFGDIEINTNQVNPFDVDQMLSMIGVDAAAIAKAEAAAPATPDAAPELSPEPASKAPEASEPPEAAPAAKQPAPEKAEAAPAAEASPAPAEALPSAPEEAPASEEE